MRRLLRSVTHAVRGLRYTFRHEENFQIELVAAIFVFALMYIVGVTSEEKSFLIFAIMLVLVLELVNTSVERIVDLLKPRVHPYVRVVKDTMAAAVLVAAVSSVMVGAIIFVPYFLRMTSW